MIFPSNFFCSKKLTTSSWWSTLIPFSRSVLTISKWPSAAALWSAVCPVCKKKSREIKKKFRNSKTCNKTHAKLSRIKPFLSREFSKVIMMMAGKMARWRFGQILTISRYFLQKVLILMLNMWMEWLHLICKEGHFDVVVFWYQFECSTWTWKNSFWLAKKKG